jgi:MFS family permease
MMRLPEPYRGLLLPVYLPSFLMALAQEAVLILLPLFALEIGYGAPFAAFIVGLRGVGVLLFDVPSGMLVARFGDKPVFTGGIAAIVASTLALGASAHPAVLALAAVLHGAGSAAWMLGRQSYVANAVETHRVGRAIAVMAGVQRGGVLFGPALGGLVAAVLGYPAAFAVAAVSAIAALVSVLARARAGEPGDPGDSGLTGTARIVREQIGVYATAGLSALVLQLMRGTRQLLVPLFGQAVGLDVATIGLVYSLSAGIDMCLFYPVGMLVDRRGRKWSAVPSMLTFALGLSLLPWVDGLGWLVAAALLLGLANGLGTGIVMIMGADLALRSSQRSQFLGVWRLICDFGMSGAPFLTGFLINVSGLAAASFAVSGIGFAGAAVMAYCVAETLRGP